MVDVSTKNNTRFHSVAELAKAVGVTPGRIRQFITAGEIVTEKLGREHLIPAKAFTKFVREFVRSNRGRPRNEKNDDDS